MKTTHVCPVCHRAYGPDVRLCVSCGVDLRTGRKIKSQVLAPAEPEPEPLAVEEEEDSRPPSLLVKLLLLPPALLPGLARPVLFIVSLVVGLLGLAIITMGLFFTVAFMAVLSGVAIMGTGMVLYAQAVVWMIGGDYDVLAEAMSDFDSINWTTFFVFMAVPFIPLMIMFMQQRPGP